jgi:hypothetical protein
MVQAEMERRVAELCSSKQWSEQDAQLVLDALKGSGETVAAFARRMKLVPQRIDWWRKRLGHREESRLAAFVPMVVRAEPRATEQANARATVSCGAVRVEVRDLNAASAAWVAAVMNSLRATP